MRAARTTTGITVGEHRAAHLSGLTTDRQVPEQARQGADTQGGAQRTEAGTDATHAPHVRRRVGGRVACSVVLFVIASDSHWCSRLGRVSRGFVSDIKRLMDFPRTAPTRNFGGCTLVPICYEV